MYTAKRAHTSYLECRKNSKRPNRINDARCEPFIHWMSERVRKDHWSIDACVGYARQQGLFASEAIPCTKTIYNALWNGKLPISLFDVPYALKHKKHMKWSRKNKRIYGRSIEERPDIVTEGNEIGHWEVDTVVGHREGHEAVVFTAVKKVTRNYVAIRIPERTANGIETAMNWLREQFGDKYFSRIFKTMTADNGPEFREFSQYESLGTKIYFAPPYSSYERAQHERHNGLLRGYIPKGISIEMYSDDSILNIADELNQRPRRILDYHCPAELFDKFLDEVYAIKKSS